MTLLVDAAPLVALADRRDPLRHPVREVLEAERGALVIAAPVTAEADDEYAGVARLECTYLDLDLGLADCATALLAARLNTRRVLTFDERHFRAVRPLQGGAFELLPQR